MLDWIWIILALVGIGWAFRCICALWSQEPLQTRQGRTDGNRDREREDFLARAVVLPTTQRAASSVSRPQPQPMPRPQVQPQPASRPTGNGETGPMIYYANDPHGREDREYRFNYKLVSGSWRAYILKMPSLGGRESGGAVTHRLFDGGNPYVCWDSPVKTLEDMQTISRVWADHIQEYIATGKQFG